MKLHIILIALLLISLLSNTTFAVTNTSIVLTPDFSGNRINFYVSMNGNGAPIQTGMSWNFTRGYVLKLPLFNSSSGTPAMQNYYSAPFFFSCNSGSTYCSATTYFDLGQSLCTLLNMSVSGGNSSTWINYYNYLNCRKSVV